MPNQRAPRITPLLPIQCILYALSLSLSPLLLLLPTLVPWASSRAFTEILAPRCLGRALRIFEKVSLEKAVRERERKKDSPLSSFFLLFFWIKDRDSVDRRRVKTETRVREREKGGEKGEVACTRRRFSSFVREPDYIPEVLTRRNYTAKGTKRRMPSEYSY